MTWYLSKPINAQCLRTCFDVWLGVSHESHRKPINNKKIKQTVWVQTVQFQIGSMAKDKGKKSCSNKKNLKKKNLTPKTQFCKLRKLTFAL